MRNYKSVNTDDYRTTPLLEEYTPLASTHNAIGWCYETDKYRTEGLKTERSKRKWASTLLSYPLLSWRYIMIVMVLPLLLGGILAYFLPLSSVVDALAAHNSKTYVAQRQPSAVVHPMQDATAMADTTTPSGLASPELQSEWEKSGYSILDATEATDVAMTFTQRYQTIDHRSLSTLSAARFILTQAANSRFAATDERNNARFIASAQQQHLIQATSITGAHVVKLQRHKGHFFAWVTVSYQLYRSNQGQTSIEKGLTQQVLLTAVPFSTPQTAPAMGGIGWLVCNFQRGSTLPTIPRQP